VIPSTTPHCRNVMTSQGEFPASDLNNETGRWSASFGMDRGRVVRLAVLRFRLSVQIPGSMRRHRHGLVFPPANDTMDV
jgi:hypothetical protein